MTGIAAVTLCSHLPGADQGNEGAEEARAVVRSRVKPLVIIKLRSDYKTLLSSPSLNLPQDVDLSCLSAHELNDEYQSHHLSSQISKSESTVYTFIELEKKQSSEIGTRFRISVDNKNP